MEKSVRNLILLIVAALLLMAAGGYFLYLSEHQRFAKLDAFAKCINSSGAKFYGAFWCPHCQKQKSMFETVFESAAKDLPYVECSTPNSNGQLQVCIDQEIKTYPTWKFADGLTSEGETTFADLANKTGCVSP